MSIGKWLARKGAVGGTARWVGTGYLSLKKQNPNASIDQLMLALVAMRYSSGSMNQAQETLVSIIQNGGMRGLAHLATNILGIEAGFNENTQENRYLFMDIIQEELLKLGIPEVCIYDPLRR
jgi:hypothetical protein